MLRCRPKQRTLGAAAGEERCAGTKFRLRRVLRDLRASARNNAERLVGVFYARPSATACAVTASHLLRCHELAPCHTGVTHLTRDPRCSSPASSSPPLAHGTFHAPRSASSSASARPRR